MTPAKQGFERADAVLLEMEQRLIEKLELAALQSEAKVGFDLAALLRALIQAFLEEGVSASSGLLRAVEREVGVAQQGAALSAVLRCDGDADAGGGDHFVAVERK